jgi:AraC-like DNA-binding protein
VQFGGIGPAQIRRHLQSLGLAVPPHDPPEIRGAIVAVLRGSCCLEVEEHKLKLSLAGGDVVLITRKDPYVLRDTWRSPVRSWLDLVRRQDLEQRRGLNYGGGGVLTTFLTGAFHFEDEENHPLLSALPPVIHVKGAEADAAPWFDGTLRFLSNELAMRRPGSQNIVNHLMHVLFVQAVRVYAASVAGGSPANWFHAIFDPDLASVLALMHVRPEQAWTVASLAEQACISRSAFSARFAAVVGCPPLHYLTECRMRKARMLLRDTNLGVKMIATKVGYFNESAFSSAFKRVGGMSPAAYRRSRPVPPHVRFGE